MSVYQYQQFQDEDCKNQKNTFAQDKQKSKQQNKEEIEDSCRQDVSFEIYSDEEQRKIAADEQKEKEQEELEEQRKQKISKIISFVFGVLPIVIMVGIFLLFSFNDDIKQRVIDMFANIKQLNFEISFYLIVYGALLIFLSFPYLIFEMSLGFTFSFPVAVFFAVFAKTIGEVLCFSLSRYVMKGCCLKFLRMNEYFIVLERAVKKYPWLVANLLRGSVLVPLFVVNFGSGIIDISFVQFIVPAILWGTIYSIFAVLCGSQLLNIKEVLENAAFPQNKLLFFFELVMVVISVAILVAIIWKSGQMYEEIQREIQEQIQMEKQMQSTKAIESATNLNLKSGKQVSVSFSSLDAIDEESQRQKRQGRQSKDVKFNAFSIYDNSKSEVTSSHNQKI